MELVKIKGVQKNKPAREECKNMLTMADIIEGVNAVLNPGKPKINWFAPADDAVAAVHIKDGKYDETTSNPSVVYGGKVSDNKVENLKVVAYEGTEGAIYAEGAGTDVTVDTAYISLAGDGQGIGETGQWCISKIQCKTDHQKCSDRYKRKNPLCNSCRGRFCIESIRFRNLRTRYSIW